MQNIGNERRQEPKILKKIILKLMVDTWGNFSLKKEIPTTLKYFLKKNLRFLLEQDIVGKIILASFSLNVTLQ